MAKHNKDRSAKHINEGDLIENPDTESPIQMGFAYNPVYDNKVLCGFEIIPVRLAYSKASGAEKDKETIPSNIVTKLGLKESLEYVIDYSGPFEMTGLTPETSIHCYARKSLAVGHFVDRVLEKQGKIETQREKGPDANGDTVEYYEITPSITPKYLKDMRRPSGITELNISLEDAASLTLISQTVKEILLRGNANGKKIETLLEAFKLADSRDQRQTARLEKIFKSGVKALDKAPELYVTIESALQEGLLVESDFKEIESLTVWGDRSQTKLSEIMTALSKESHPIIDEIWHEDIDHLEQKPMAALKEKIKTAWFTFAEMTIGKGETLEVAEGENKRVIQLRYPTLSKS